MYQSYHQPPLSNKQQQQSLHSKILYFPNPEVLQDLQHLRIAFGLTLKSISQRNQLLQVQSQRFNQLISSYQQKIHRSQNKITQLQKNYQQLKYQMMIKQRQFELRKQQLDRFQYKIKEAKANRDALRQSQHKHAIQDKIDEDLKKSLQSQFYLQISDVLKTKIYKFIKQFQNERISLSAQTKLQNFLSQLIYINPHLKNKINYLQIYSHNKNQNKAENSINYHTSSPKRKYVGSIVQYDRNDIYKARQIKKLQNDDKTLEHLLKIKKQIQQQQRPKNNPININEKSSYPSSSKKLNKSIASNSGIKNNSIYRNLNSSMIQY